MNLRLKDEAKGKSMAIMRTIPPRLTPPDIRAATRESLNLVGNEAWAPYMAMLLAISSRPQHMQHLNALPELSKFRLLETDLQDLQLTWLLAWGDDLPNGDIPAWSDAVCVQLLMAMVPQGYTRKGLSDYYLASLQAKMRPLNQTTILWDPVIHPEENQNCDLQLAVRIPGIDGLIPVQIGKHLHQPKFDIEIMFDSTTLTAKGTQQLLDVLGDWSIQVVQRPDGLEMHCEVTIVSPPMPVKGVLERLWSYSSGKHDKVWEDWRPNWQDYEQDLLRAVKANLGLEISFGLIDTSQ